MPWAHGGSPKLCVNSLSVSLLRRQQLRLSLRALRTPK